MTLKQADRVAGVVFVASIAVFGAAVLSLVMIIIGGLWIRFFGAEPPPWGLTAVGFCGLVAVSAGVVTLTTIGVGVVLETLLERP